MRGVEKTFYSFFFFNSLSHSFANNSFFHKYLRNWLERKSYIDLWLIWSGTDPHPTRPHLFVCLFVCVFVFVFECVFVSVCVCYSYELVRIINIMCWSGTNPPPPSHTCCFCICICILMCICFWIGQLQLWVGQNNHQVLVRNPTPPSHTCFLFVYLYRNLNGYLFLYLSVKTMNWSE